jgi:hypothetical protein
VIALRSLAALTVEDVPLDDLRPDPANPRRISEDEPEAGSRLGSSANETTPEAERLRCALIGADRWFAIVG